MADLVKKQEWGDVTFGIPPDITLLNRPWGFYELLGVPPTASSEDLKKAYKQMAFKLHPDRGGSEEDFKRLQMVADILLDNDEELGHEHSRRTHYDEVSSLDSFFDEYMVCEGERTRKFSEIRLIQMQIDRKETQAEIEITKAAPEFKELKEELQKTHSMQKQEEIAGKIRETIAKAKGVAREVIEQMEQAFKSSMERHKAELGKFIGTLAASPENYRKKILDLYHMGGERYSKVEFGADEWKLRLGISSYLDKKHILELIIGGDAYISGFPQVHFKAESADVDISDPRLHGIFHILKGKVSIYYHNGPPNYVIRARAPNIMLHAGGMGHEVFEQRGELLIPKKHASEEWWRRKPALDIAVHEGGINVYAIMPKPVDRSFRVGDYLATIDFDKLIENSKSDKFKRDSEKKYNPKNLDDLINDYYKKKY